MCCVLPLENTRKATSKSSLLLFFPSGDKILSCKNKSFFLNSTILYSWLNYICFVFICFSVMCLLPFLLYWYISMKPIFILINMPVTLVTLAESNCHISLLNRMRWSKRATKSQLSEKNLLLPHISLFHIVCPSHMTSCPTDVEKELKFQITKSQSLSRLWSLFDCGSNTRFSLTCHSFFWETCRKTVRFESFHCKCNFCMSSK